jgi:senescence-induced receptor-like serine/threonine-protein kinase
MVMQTAATTSSTREPFVMNWIGDSWKKYSVFLYFAEIQDILSNELREFNISARGVLMTGGYNPRLLQSDARGYYDSSVNQYSFSLVATSRSTLPPLLNAVDVYIKAPLSSLLTDGEDGN